MTITVHMAGRHPVEFDNLADALAALALSCPHGYTLAPWTSAGGWTMDIVGPFTPQGERDGYVFLS
jgi:hypothetical protein